MNDHPTGTVTFLFTDIEGSTRRWEEHPALMTAAFARQEALLRQAIREYGGYAYKQIGDAFQAAFQTAPAALAAAVAAQRTLHAEPWGQVGPLRVRMALHTGSTEERGEDYVGPLLNRLARLLAAGRGGQVLLTAPTTELVREDLPPGVALRDLGERRLRDLQRPEHVWQVMIAGLPTDFPPLKTLDTHPTNLPRPPNMMIGRGRRSPRWRGDRAADRGSALALLGSARIPDRRNSHGAQAACAAWHRTARYREDGANPDD